MKEIIFVHVGQAGVQIGSSMWETFCQEHNLDAQGKVKLSKEGGIHTCFEETKQGNLKPRAILADSDPMTIEEINSIRHSNQTYFPNQFSNVLRRCEKVIGKESYGSLYSLGKRATTEMIEQTLFSLKLQMQKADNPQGIVFTHSICGGTGSGFVSRILEQSQSIYPKLFKTCVTIFPSKNYHSLTVQPYNAVLATKDLIQYCDLVFPITNEKLYKIYETKMGIQAPSFLDINKLIGQTCSTMTIDTRFPQKSRQNSDFQTLATNLVFYPKSHFITTSYSPFPTFTGSSLPNYNHHLTPLAKQAFKTSNDFVTNVDYSSGYIVSANLCFRGKNINHFQAIQAAKAIRNCKKQFKFSEFGMNGMKVNINQKQSCLYRKTANVSDVTVMNFCNTSNITELFGKFTFQCDKLHSKRSFCHWLTLAALEEGELGEAREQIAFLEKNYNTMHRQQCYGPQEEQE